MEHNKIEQRLVVSTVLVRQKSVICGIWLPKIREGRSMPVLEKLEAARDALGGRVYDVLGELFE